MAKEIAEPANMLQASVKYSQDLAKDLSINNELFSKTKSLRIYLDNVEPRL